MDQTSVNRKPGALRVGDQRGDGARGEAGDRRVGPARQDDRNPGAEHDAGRVGIGQEGQALGEHVARLEVRDDEDIGQSGDRRLDVLDLRRPEIDGVVERQRAVEDPAGDLAAVGHLAEGGGLDGRGHLGIHGLHRRQDRDPHRVDPQRPGEVDGVLDDMDLVLQGRSDVDRRVGDDQRIGVARHVHDEAMADPAGGPQAAFAADHGAHEFVRVQAPLHQRLGLAGPHEVDGLLGRRMAVRCVDDPDAGQVLAERLRERL